MFNPKRNCFLTALRFIYKTDDVVLPISCLLIFKGVHVFAALVTPVATLGAPSRLAIAPSRPLLSQTSPAPREMLHHRSAMTDCYRDRMRGLLPTTPRWLVNATYQIATCLPAGRYAIYSCRVHF